MCLRSPVAHPLFLRKLPSIQSETFFSYLLLYTGFAQTFQQKPPVNIMTMKRRMSKSSKTKNSLTERKGCIA